jgi:UDP-glucose 4-epimerase
MKKAVLITGAHGFLGINTAFQFSQNGCYIVGIGHGKWLEDEYSKYGIKKWIESEISTDFLHAIRTKFDIIVHCAGGSTVEYANSYPDEDFSKTVNTTLSILEYMRKYNNKARLIYPSTAAVYGHNQYNNPIKESDNLNPISIYGKHKKDAEKLCINYNKMYGLNINIVRFFSLFGNGLKKQIFWDACNKFTKANNIKFDGVGNELRDFLHISDAVNLIEIISQKDNNFEIINGASGKSVEIRHVLDILSKYFNKKYIFNGQTREGQPAKYNANISKALSFGWKPKMDLEEGIISYINWFKNDKND